jgi:DNA topoisomerase-1
MAKGKSLIIVESPTKIKTLKKFLGPNYIFESSRGHIRDLPAKEFGIDIENDFEPIYSIMPDKEPVIALLKKAAKEVDIVYLSPDPDREGEAIAWHISQILPPGTKYQRVSFNSITKDEVVRALEHPREIDQSLVNAQQARRLLDRLVGYTISPILNRRIQRGREGFLSAGRVQSVALKLVVDREKEIDAFKPVEYWNLGALLKTTEQEKSFRANLYSVDGLRVEKEATEGKESFLINNKEIADQVMLRFNETNFLVTKVEKKEKKRNPVPPFITSTLQQEASRHFGFSSSRTMSIAQSLYEGLDLGNEGAEGLITYMRTDSVRVANEAIVEVRAFIQSQYGADYLPESGKQYTSQKSAQEAHEAIRPTNLKHPPDAIQQYLSDEQFLLYQLIWRRFVASQMMPAVYDTVSADISTITGLILRATGSTLKFSGFLAAYEEKVDEDEKDDDSRILPNLEEGQNLVLLDLISEQAFTRPPPRFSEASLVKELEKLGIGRPSTYAPIMNKIQSREYTVKESGRLKPTELGKIIAQMLETSFQQIMNVTFTADMENALEDVAGNKKDWKILLKDFWGKFEPIVETAKKEAFVPKVQTDIDCPLCKEGKLQKIWSRSKYFYGCTRYPDCSFTASQEEMEFKKEDYSEEFDWNQRCPICQSEMKIRHGRYGTFLGCTKYPDCKGVVKIPKKGEIIIPPEDMPPCPAIGCPGRMVSRKSRFGKTFYSCSTFPECDVIVNDLSKLESKYPDHARTAYVKKEKKWVKAAKEKAKAKPEKKAKAEKKPKAKKKSSTGKAPGGTYKLSPELSAVINVTESSRPEVVKKIWDYIKENKLQDPANKRLIKPDDKLAKVFGSSDPIDMMKLAGLLGKHFEK